MPNHVDPEDAMRPGKDYTAEQLNGLLALLNSKYDLRGGDIDTHPVLGASVSASRRRWTRRTGG